ncbi:MAG: NUDIX hydrolase [Candidatus Gallionella acididurans]|uniref:GDP-mannose pyrophosphatase n=1 Tax=Candidatus Gallionella acididurans TaxID=1796491 RepID=A0A139BPW2_9PROT|nr:MAG: NUDIX hydrolase [Candidatus Gallionella acididurans]
MEPVKIEPGSSWNAGNQMELKETCLDTELVYQGDFIRVRKDRIRLPDGKTGSREYINHPGAVAVLALLDNGNLVMERQFRYAPQREFIELPAGKIDPGEDILVCAKRELQEETGYVAGEWIHLTTAWPCIGYADERMEYFLARGLAHVGRKLDDGEFLEVFELSLAEALEWVRLGKINESKTIVGLFWLEKYLNGWKA